MVAFRYYMPGGEPAFLIYYKRDVGGRWNASRLVYKGSAGFAAAWAKAEDIPEGALTPNG
jgi:hypothetical protein